MAVISLRPVLQICSFVKKKKKNKFNYLSLLLGFKLAMSPGTCDQRMTEWLVIISLHKIQVTRSLG